MQKRKQSEYIRVIFTDEQAEKLPKGEPYAAYIAFCDWTQGHQVMMHRHEDIAEILLILKGHGRYSVGLHRCEIEGGDVILCNQDVPHDEFPESDETYETLCLGVKGLQLPELAAGQLIGDDRIPVLHHPSQFAEMETLMRMILKHATQKTHMNRMLCQHLMLAVLDLTQQMTAGTKPEPMPQEHELIVRVERYIDQFYARDLSIERLSQRFYISSYHLAHLFKKYTGYTIKQYILRRRVGEAQVMLYDTTDSISEIAQAVGFEDAAYFSRLFSKYVGMSPREFREFRVKK